MISEQRARNLAVKYMEEYSLFDAGWSFGFDRAKARFGQTHFGRKTITLSRPFLSHVTEEQLIDTILHEIAHALAGPGVGHGPAWRNIARAIGANPTATKDHDGTVPRAAWKGVCPCGHETTMHRAPGRVKACAICGAGKWYFDNIYTWYKHGKEMSITDMPSKYQTEYMSKVLVYGLDTLEVGV